MNEIYYCTLINELIDGKGLRGGGGWRYSLNEFAFFFC